MKQRPILFNGEMVRAILDGRKTQTRRVVANVSPDNCVPLQKRTKTKDGIYTHVLDAPKYDLCPFGTVGDRLWVRETWAEAGASAIELTLYRASYPEHVPSHCEFIPKAETILWKPSIHMPRWASRITLEITSVLVERLNDISQEDAQAEGMELTGWRPTYSDPDSGGDVQTPYDNFAELWQSIYGEESWQSNPWVWVVEFKRVDAS